MHKAAFVKKTDDDADILLEQAMQRLTLTLHKENARAILRRAHAAGMVADPALAAAQALLGAAGGA